MVKRPKVKFEKHVRLHAWLLKSAAWKALNVTERAMLVEIYSWYNTVGIYIEYRLYQNLIFAFPLACHINRYSVE